MIRSRELHFVSLCMVIVAVSVPLFVGGCGRKTESPLQDQVDFSKATSIFSSPASPAGMPTPDTVLAVVEGRSITQADLMRETNLLLLALRNRIKPEDVDSAAPRIANEAFQNLIKQALLLDAAEREVILADRDVIEERLTAMRDRLPEGKTWKDVLREGEVTENQLREQLDTSLRIEEVLRLHTGETEPVDEEDIATFYKENVDRFVQPNAAEFSHLLIRVAPDADEEEIAAAKEKAEQLLKLAKGEVAFESLTAKYSDDEGSKSKGGFVGKVAQGRLPPELDDAVFSYEPGELGPVVRSSSGFHLVLVESREAERQLELDEVSGVVSNLIARQRTQVKVNAYLDELREAADIEIRTPNPPPSTTDTTP